MTGRQKVDRPDRRVPSNRIGFAVRIPFYGGKAMRRPLRVLGVLALLPLLLAADSVTLDKATPNPDAKSNVLKGEGTIPDRTSVVGSSSLPRVPTGTR